MMTTIDLPTIPTRPRDVQTAEIGTNTTIFRSRTWDRLKFEVEYALAKGTTANSYLIKGDRIALIDPPGESFSNIFLEELEKNLDLNKLNYLILSHVNSNRLATLKLLLEKAPQVTIICSRPGTNAIKNALPQWENQIQTIRSEDTLDLGQGHILEFLFLPTPRWADGICTYDQKTRILYTDKLFGSHVCSDLIFDEDWKQLDHDRRYYFDCLHAAQSKQIEITLDKIEKYNPKYYAPAHGSVIRYSLSRLNYDYRQWCQQQQSKIFKVALIYASAYGNTAILANAIAQGFMISNDTMIESINCEYSTSEEIASIIEDCDGVIIGSPTLGGHAPVQIQTALGVILSTLPKTKLVGVFGSYGWSGEAIDLIEGKLKDANYPFGFETIKVRFTPNLSSLEKCQYAGAEFAQNLRKSKKQRTRFQSLTEAQIDRTEQAVGRVVGSLCVLTTNQGGNHQGFLTSWVSQATFSPPGLMISINKNLAQETALEIGNSFTLNVLKEGRNIRKHFAFQKAQAQNTFAEVDTTMANNGCLIITEALAYLECKIQQRLDAGDCWLIYGMIENGNVLENQGTTAIYHRKSGRQY